MIVNLWHDSSQRRRDLPEKREESEAARTAKIVESGDRGEDQRPDSFGRPETRRMRALARFAERKADGQAGLLV